MLLILQVSLSPVDRTVKFDTLERLKTPSLPSKRRGTPSLTADRYCGLRGRIKKPTYERATIYERLRELPDLDTP